MEDKAAAARRAYNQAYYRRNREKIRQQQAEYWKLSLIHISEPTRH